MRVEERTRDGARMERDVDGEFLRAGTDEEGRKTVEERKRVDDATEDEIFVGVK